MRFIALLMVLFSISAHASEASEIREAGKSIFRLLGNGGGGTGWQVEVSPNEHYIVTNDHVCGLAIDGQFLIVDSPYYPIYYSQIIARSQLTDLCILKPSKQAPSLHLGSEAIPGQYIMVLGHPHLNPLTATYGRIGAYSIIDIMQFMSLTPNFDSSLCEGSKHYVRKSIGGLFSACFQRVHSQVTDALVQPGSSGSPVLDEHMRVVGVAFAANTSGFTSFIIPLKELREFVVAHKYK